MNNLGPGPNSGAEAQIRSQRWAQDGMVRTYWLLPGQNPPEGAPVHNAPVEELADLLDDWKVV
jgi:hypothetical protein